MTSGYASTANTDCLMGATSASVVADVKLAARTTVTDGVSSVPFEILLANACGETGSESTPHLLPAPRSPNETRDADDALVNASLLLLLSPVLPNAFTLGAVAETESPASPTLDGAAADALNSSDAQAPTAPAHAGSRHAISDDIAWAFPATAGPKQGSSLEVDAVPAGAKLSKLMQNPDTVQPLRTDPAEDEAFHTAAVSNAGPAQPTPAHHSQPAGTSAPAPTASQLAAAGTSPSHEVQIASVRWVERLPDGTGSLEISLHPSHLGRVEVLVRSDGSSVSATLLAPDQAVCAALRAQLGVLHTALLSAGIAVGELNVGLGGSDHREPPAPRFSEKNRGLTSSLGRAANSVRMWARPVLYGLALDVFA
ncbi:MAG: flagellar hook-length control protein FliK [Armatimonadota bacterium]